QTPGSGISILLAVGTPSTGSGNLYCQWELSPGSGNALCILFPTLMSPSWALLCTKWMSRVHFYMELLRKKSPRAWYETLATYLLENGFQRGIIDQTLFIKKQKGDILLVQIYVDDIIFGVTNKDLCKSFETLMKDKYQISSIGELTFFLGLQVKQKKDGIFISQDKYVAEILRKFGLTKVKSASTPIDIEKPLLKDPDGEDVYVHTYSYIKYAITVNPNICVSCIKQFGNTIVVKQTDDVTRLQALVDRKKVVITDATIRDVLRLDDAEGVDCLPNEEIFIELARMSYEKPSIKLTFYKAFFSSKWKFLIHTILQSMSAKRTSWNEFSSAMAFAVICLSISRKFNFSKYIFDSLVRNVDSTSKFYMYPRFIQLLIRNQLVRVSTASTKRRKRVVIRDPKEESTTIIPADTKSKDKGKGIMLEDPKPLKKKQQVEMDEKYARKLHAELNKDIDWDVAIEHVKQKAKEDPVVQIYQVMKKKP
nr:putative ribonuclease H-like domain-containing protein [Tanacetum cinerariifolium]